MPRSLQNGERGHRLEHSECGLQGGDGALGETVAGRGTRGYTRTPSLAMVGRQIRRFQPLPVLPTHKAGHRGHDAYVCPSWAEKGSRALSPWAGNRYSHNLKGWQLIKDPRLQIGEDVSRYVSAGNREPGS